MAPHRPSVVALIPARSGSKRVPNKNVRLLAGHPLIAYAVAAARASGVFDAVIVSTDSEAYAEVARHYGAEAPVLRPPAFAYDRSPDIDWVEHLLTSLRTQGRTYECFSLLRPTSPFRSADTIRRAWAHFLDQEAIDSIRAVGPCRQHPAKMWIVQGRVMCPLLPYGPREQPWHSRQYAALPLIHVQNASLELAWTRVVFDGRTIAGDVVAPFFTTGHEGFDINDPYDWILAEHLVASGDASLPSIDVLHSIDAVRNVASVVRS